MDIMVLLPRECLEDVHIVQFNFHLKSYLLLERQEMDC